MCERRISPTVFEWNRLIFVPWALIGTIIREFFCQWGDLGDRGVSCCYFGSLCTRPSHSSWASSRLSRRSQIHHRSPWLAKTYQSCNMQPVSSLVCSWLPCWVLMSPGQAIRRILISKSQFPLSKVWTHSITHCHLGRTVETCHSSFNGDMAWRYTFRDCHDGSGENLLTFFSHRTSSFLTLNFDS